MPSIPGEEVEPVHPTIHPPPTHASVMSNEESRLIVLSPEDPDDFYYDELDEMDDGRLYRKPSLTTISERTEHTEDSHNWNRGGEHTSEGRRATRSSWTSTVDYGEVIGG